MSRENRPIEKRNTLDAVPRRAASRLSTAVAGGSCWAAQAEDSPAWGDKSFAAQESRCPGRRQEDFGSGSAADWFRAGSGAAPRSAAWHSEEQVQHSAGREYCRAAEAPRGRLRDAFAREQLPSDW